MSNATEPTGARDVPAQTLSFGGASMSPKRFLPLAFALFGGVAGLFAILALGAFREPARSVLPLTPLIATSLIGVLAGKLLAGMQWQPGGATASFEMPFEVTLIRVGGVTMLAGAASGAVVGFATWGTDGVARFAMGGAALGLLSYPGCHAVFRAAVNAARARHGSRVAEADMRTVGSTLLAGAAALSATQVPALLKVTPSTFLHPVVQASCSLVVCVAAVIAIVRMQRKDAQLQSTLPSLSQTEGFEVVTEPLAIAADAVDLGLGDEHLAQAGGYRAQASEVKLRGSIVGARAAVAQSVRARHYALLIAASALVQVSGAIAMRLSDLFRFTEIG
jgi:hypothetical protein